MTEQLNSKPKPEAKDAQPQEPRLTLRLRLNQNDTLYVAARNDAEVRVAMLALPGLSVRLPDRKK